jgi:hypothetical protein
MSDPSFDDLDEAFDDVDADDVDADDEFDDDEGSDDDEFDDEGSDDERGVELRVDEIEDPVSHLLRGEIHIEGRMPYSSNATFLVHVV